MNTEHCSSTVVQLTKPDSDPVLLKPLVSYLFQSFGSV